MKSFLVLCTVLGAVTCIRDPFAHLELQRGEMKGRIVGGQEVTDPQAIPYIVGIITHFAAENGWCGGSLITENYVLTAGDCVYELVSATVLLGASNMAVIEQMIPVANIIVHPGFRPSSLTDDLGLLQLARPARLTDTIKLIRLPRRSQQGQSFNNEDGKISGWGTGGGSGQVYPTQRLQTITLSVITNLVCTASFPIYISSSNICTSSFRGTPCYGDEGGPMTITEADGVETLIGVTSFTASWGCSSVWPAVYSRVTSYLDWIAENSDAVIEN